MSQEHDLIKLKEDIKDMLSKAPDGVIMDLYKGLLKKRVKDTVELCIDAIDDYSQLRKIVRLIETGNKWYE